VPARLRPTAPIAADAILVGDPGRALLLAQELLEQPKMSNHARGLWGYSGRTPSGLELTLQSTGMGGPSAALVLADLAELGVRRAIRVGTCCSLAQGWELGQILLVETALASGGNTGALGGPAGVPSQPDAALTAAFGEALGKEGRPAVVASGDSHPAELPLPAGAIAADMQTASLFVRAAGLGVACAAALIVTEMASGQALSDEALEEAAKRAGRAAATALST
jgi:uridine phosphorylase